MKTGFLILLRPLMCVYGYFVFNSFGEFWCWDQFLGKERDPKFTGPPLTFVIG